MFVRYTCIALSRLASARLLIGQITPCSGLSLAAISHSVWEYLLMYPLIKSLFVSIWSMTAPMFPSSLVLRAATHVNWCLKSHNRAHFNTLWRILSQRQIKKHSLTKIKSNALIFLLPGAVAWLELCNKLWLAETSIGDQWSHDSCLVVSLSI